MGQLALAGASAVIRAPQWVANADFHIHAGCADETEYSPSSGTGQTNVIFPVQ